MDAPDVHPDQLVYARDRFACVYCGFSGHSFHSWRQLTIDHVIPKHQDGSEDPSNKAVACHSCNSMTSRMTFPPGTSVEDARAEKRRKVHERLPEWLDFWLKVRTIKTGPAA